MSEESTGTSTNPAGQPQTSPAQPPAPPAAPGPETPPAAPPVPPPSNQIDPDVRERRFDTARGQWMQYASEVAAWQGSVQQQMATLRAVLNDRVARVGQLEQQVTTLQEQLQSVPGLQQQASQAVSTQAQLERLKQITAYPEIVNRVQEQAVTREDGTTETVRVNPILDMLMNSSMEGDAFHQTLVGVVASLTTQGQTPATPPPQSPPSAGMTPTPMAASEEEEFWARYNEAQNRGDKDRLGELLQEWAEKQDQKRK